MRLIDVDDAIEKINCLCVDDNENWIGTENQSFVDHADVIDILSSIPTVDAVPVVHGRWKTMECDMGEVGGYAPYIVVECSNCGEAVGIEEGQYGWAYGDPFPWKCCPLCEAKMYGGDEDGTTQV